ncbi:MAG: DUF4465 domain-containing protein [Prevotella sp.]|nr:DUF4465 domain-containing protein [Prevotella sp.]
MKKSLLFMAAFAAFALGAHAADDNTATFEDVTLGTDTLLDVTSGSSFTSGNFVFDYSYDSRWGTKSGFIVSGKKATNFVDYTTAYNSCVGHGYDGSNNFAVYYPSYGTASSITAKDGSAQTISGFYGAVNTYVQNSILKGDNYAKAFTTGSWLRLDVIGTKADDSVDTLSFYLADYRSTDEAAHYYLKDWTWFDLSALGEVKSITFAFDGSDKGDYGLNTPTYVLVDNYDGSYDGTSAKAQNADRTTATSIATVFRREDNVNAPVYNLAGQRVGRDYKGVVIKNGRKYIQ